MNLFKKEKDLIFKIANLVLLVLLMVFITGFWVNLMEVLVPNKIPTYNEFKQTYCEYGYNCSFDLNCVVESSATKYTKEECKDFYNSQVSYQKEIKYEDKKRVFIALGNSLIVGFAIYILNRKKV